jgi:3'-5' exonuclease
MIRMHVRKRSHATETFAAFRSKILKRINMYVLDDIMNWLFIDIETVSEERSLETLKEKNPAKAELWKKRCEYLRRRYVECEEMDDAQLYNEKAALHAEFCKIVCICLGVYNGNGAAQVVGVAKANDERLTIEAAFAIINKMKNAVYNKSRTATMWLAGHNIKRFDVPVLCKRALMHKLTLPDILMVHNKKPWEMGFIDTAEVWSFGTWQESFTSLELLTNVLGIPSPKADMHGSDVQEVYWNSGRWSVSPPPEDSLKMITHYCQDDVIATMNVVLDWSSLPLVDFEKAVRAAR